MFAIYAHVCNIPLQIYDALLYVKFIFKLPNNYSNYQDLQFFQLRIPTGATGDFLRFALRMAILDFSSGNGI